MTDTETAEQSFEDFSDDFFNRKIPNTSEKQKDGEEVKEDVLQEVDEDVVEEQETEQVEETSSEKPVKISRAQERIRDLNSKYRETEKKLAEALEQLNKTQQPPKQQTAVVADTSPQPDELNEDGTEKYPLGEFDPKYIRDLTRHTLREEQQIAKKEFEEQARQEAIALQKQELEDEWSVKVLDAQERMPDLQEKTVDLIESFDALPTAYGEYLSATIMAMDHGVDVLYYLANNLDEARKIVAAGPTKATLALGRIEASFSDKKPAANLTSRVKISKAPEPPQHTNKGSAAAKTETPYDTDDLEAFSKMFFAGRRR